MGSGLIASGSRVHGDSSLFIYAVEQHPVFGRAYQELILRAESRDILLFANELLIPEILTMPLRQKDFDLVARFEELLAQPWIVLLPIDQATLRRAALIRADDTSIRTPDAIHFASFELNQGNHFVTNDATLAKFVDSSAILINQI